MILFVRRIVLVAALCVLALSSRAAPRAEHVFIISLDGGKPADIQQSRMPVLERLVAEGAHTWTANTIFPSTTLPGHTSMLTGVGPEKHHILWNSWVPTNGMVGVPTVFSEAKRAGFTTAMFVGKEKFRHLLRTNSVDEFNYHNSVARKVVKSDSGVGKVKKEGTVLGDQVVRDAAAYIVQHKPNLCFIHFADPDVAGHKYGWGSTKQLKSFAQADADLDVVLKAIREAGIADESVVIVSADHGGHGKGHGTKSPEDMHIPWIAWGKGVRKGFTITAPVTTYDTAATALWLLDVTCPASLDGQPVTSAFE
jgi:predicted AlkP superfamily pyrophosphatase or phosphodiesterase